jgi:hypothetical protein
VEPVRNLSDHMTTLDYPIGITAEPDASYFRRVLGEANKSGLDEFARSPAHYKAWCEAADDHQTPALIFGKAFHHYVLENATFGRHYMLPPAGAPRRPSITQLNAKNPSPDTVAAIEYWCQFDALHAGKTMITGEDYDTIRRMTDAIARHELARNLMMAGQREATARWIDPATGIRCKARADYFVPEAGWVFDLKTTSDASPQAFAKSVASYRYHVQDAFYTAGFRALGAPVDHFFFAAVEKEPPYAVSVLVCDVAAIDRAEELIRRDMARLAQCIERDEWPAYGNEVHHISLPAWALTDY